VVRAAEYSRDQSTHEQVDDPSDTPVHSDSDTRAVETEHGIERAGERARPAVNLRDDAVARIGLEHHQQNCSDDDEKTMTLTTRRTMRASKPAALANPRSALPSRLLCRRETVAGRRS
jgi:hypothetical protein